ncbi:hypothetical protein M9Y10_011838 [Tritrichomonas musculus]|uniref:Vacuolar protein sorting-associated protein n=1 Tax=Tritrichomonas musculus TaxID=1915356 RepID=A0ABR2IB04_9EUKA
MINGIVAKIISHLCGQYIEKIDSSQLELEIWNGKAHMENVKIMENSFLAHQIPFRVKQGIIGSISLAFPWSRLSTEPCIVDIENLLLVGEIYGGALISHDLTIQESTNKTEITEQTMWDRMLLNILDNLIINIKNVHIRIESPTNNQQYISTGVVIPSINVHTVNEEGEKIILKEHQNFLLKKVTINNIGIYADTESIEIYNNDIESFKTKMINEIKTENHQFVLNPFSFDGIFKSSSQNINPESSFSMISEIIELTLDNQQFKGLQILMNQYRLFCKQRLYSHCGRPDRPPRSERSSTLWWCYAHRCSLDRNNWNLLDVNVAIEMLKNRKKYFNIWSNFIKNSSAYRDQIDSFEDALDSNTVTLLRSYSTYLYQKEINSIEGKYTEGEIEVISQKVKKGGPFKLNLNLKKLLFSLKESKNSEKMTSFIINDLITEFIKTGFDNKASFQVGSFCIMNYMSNFYPRTLEASKGIKGSFDINYSEPYRIHLSVSPVFAVIDVKWIEKVVKFFEKKRTFLDIEDESQVAHQIQEIIDSHAKFILDLDIDKSKIIVPYQEINEEHQPSFDVTFNSFKLHSKPSPKYNLSEIDSLFDNYEISINNIQMFLCDKKMSDEFDFISNFEVAILTSEKIDSMKASFELSPLKFYLTTFQALLIKEMSSYISDTLKLDQENENIKSITSRNLFSIKIPSFSALLSYDEKPLYQIEIEKQINIEITNKNKVTNISVLNEESGLKGLEYFSSENNEFFNTQKLELKMEISSQNQNFDMNLGDVELYAKATPLNFIIVFAKSPINFEWKLKLNKESTIEKYLHQRKIQSIDDQIIKGNIKFNNTIVHLIDFDNSETSNKELMEITTKDASVTIDKSKNSFLVNFEIPPPLVTTKQLGEKWTNIISKDDLMTKPINLKFEPASFSINFDSFKANISPLLLFKIIKFIKIMKNSHSNQDGDPDTMPYMAFDIKARNTKIRIIYNYQSSNYYELNIPDFKFITIQTPTVHQISFDKVEIIENMNGNKLFNTENLNIEMDMKLLLKEDKNNNLKSFNQIMNEKGFDKWNEETFNLIQNEKNKMKLDKTSFYFYAVSFKFVNDDLLCAYSHEFARDITFLTKNLLEIIKFDSFYNYNNQNIQEIDEPLDIDLTFSMKTIDFIVLNETPKATLTIDGADVQINLKNNDVSFETKSVILVDNKKSKIIEANLINFQSNEDEIYSSVDNLDLVIFLEYLPISVDYIMNCPFFSFADEFKKHKTKATSFDILTSFFFSINSFSVKLPLKGNLFLFKIASDASLNPEGRIAQIRDIQMLLNDRLIIKPFSINFDNDKWIIDPVLITFSVFELYIIEQLIDKIKSLSMPKIYLSKKEVEMSRRKFSICISTVKFILTQPNLPFLWLEIKPSIFKQSYNDLNGGEKIIEYKIETLIKHANYSNCGFDTVVDPFILTFQSKDNSNSASTNVTVSPMTFSVSSSFLKEIFIFRKKFEMIKSSSNDDSKIFQDEIIYFQNDTGLPIKLTLFKDGLKKMMINENDESDENNKEKNILDDDKPFRMINFNPNYDLKVEFLDKTVYFSIKDLCFPIFFEGLAVAFIVADIGVQTIHFSSPYVIKNELPYDIEVFIGNDTIGAINSGDQKPIPINSSSSLSDGIRAAMTPIKTEISPPVSILKYHSFTLLYKIIDNNTLRNLYTTIYVSVDPKKSISYITFLPNITFVNHLPANVKMTILNDSDDFGYGGSKIEFNMKTGEEIDGSFIRTARSTITIKLNIEQFGESDPTTIYPFDTTPVPFQFIIRNDYIEICKVAMMSIYSPEKMVFQIIIFTPCVMYNETNIPLLINESKKDNKQYSFINKMLFYTPKGFFKKKKVTARALYPEKTYSNVHPIDCMHVNTLQTVLLPYFDDSSTFYQLSVITKEAPVQFNHTTVVTLATTLSVFNHFNETVYFSPSETYKFVNSCLPNRKTSLIYSNAQSTFDVYVKGYRKCRDVALTNPTTTVFRLLSENENQPDFLIQLDLIKEKSGFCGHISYPALPTPTVITNMLSDKIIYAYQDISKTNPVIVKSMSTSLFAKEQPFADSLLNEIIICIDNEITFPVSFTSDVPPMKIYGSPYFYEVRTTKRGNQMIIVTDKNETNIDPDDDDNQIIFDDGQRKKIVNVLVSKMQISFIDSLMHEICLLTLKNITFIDILKNSLKLTIDSIQLDDMYVASKSPVVLYSTSPNFLSATMMTHLPLSTHSFDSIEIKLAEIRVFADYAFISDLYAVIKEIHDESKMNKGYHPAKISQKTAKLYLSDNNSNDNNNNNNDNYSNNNNNNNTYLNSDKNIYSNNNYLNYNNNNFDNNNNNDNDSNINDNNNNDNDKFDDFGEDEKYRSAAFYSIKKFKVLPISLKLDFRGSSGREFIHPQSSDFRIAMLQYVPSVSNGRMELPPVEIKSIRAPLNIFQKHLISSYRNQFIKEVVKVLFHADLLLNAVGVVKGVVGIFTDDSRSKKESLSNLGGQLLQSVEGIMRIIPSNIHLANSKTSKVSRFSKFIGNVANVLDKGADKINTTKRELIEEVIPSRQREPRAFPMGRITNITPICNVIDLETDNNEVENDNDSYGGLSEGFCDGSSLRFSIAQNTFQKLFSIKPDHANERLLALIDSGSNDNNNSNNKSHALAIFDHYIAVLSSNLFFVIIEARITDVISVDFKGSVVDLVIYNQHEEIETFNFNCKSESEARSIVTIISSISARMHIFAE